MIRRLILSIAALTLLGAATAGAAWFPTLPTSTFGTSLYPTGPGALGLYDANSNIIANALGAKKSLLGVASQDSLHWTNTYNPGVDSAAAVTLYAISPSGRWGEYIATRASDYTSGVNGSVIGSICLAVNDNTTYADNTWCRYDQGNVTASNFYQHLNDENSVANSTGSDAAAVDPYTSNPLHSIYNLRLDSGTGSGGQDASAALDILANGAKYRSAAIIVHSGALDTAYGATPSALQLPSNYAVRWYSAASTPNWALYADASANLNALTAGTTPLIVTNTALYQLQLNNSASASGFFQIGSDSGGYTRFNAAQGVEFDTGGNPGTARLKVSNDGHITLSSPLADNAATLLASGTSYTVSGSIDRVILDSVSSPFTLTMTAAPVDGQRLLIECGASVASLTVSPNTGQTVKGTTASCSADQGHQFHYRASNTTWYKDY